jgi:hypothetical protein
VKIDLSTLKAATFGDQEKKVEVKRAWLKAVYDMLVDGQRAKEELARSNQRVRELSEEIRNLKSMDAFDETMESTFGKDGIFDKMFGKSKRGKYG